MFPTEVCLGKSRSGNLVPQQDGWLKTVARFKEGVNQPEYYKGLAVGPNFQFFYFIANLQRLPRLRLTLPTTIVCFENGNYAILYTQGRLVRRISQRLVKYHEFEQMVRERREQEIKAIEKA